MSSQSTNFEFNVVGISTSWRSPLTLRKDCHYHVHFDSIRTIKCWSLAGTATSQIHLMFLRQLFGVAEAEEDPPEFEEEEDEPDVIPEEVLLTI